MNVDIIFTHVNNLDELLLVANNSSIWIASYSPLKTRTQNKRHDNKL
jgi:hypothetical protein